MPIDERLDRLTERHEALTGHVELLTADLAQQKKTVDELTVNIDKQRRTMDDLMVGFSTLVELARRHEHRIDRLESR
jgi:DNA-binding ferritin-like protein